MIKRTLERAQRSGRNDETRKRWERRTERLMLLLAVATLPLVLVPELFELSDAVESWILIGDIVVWAAFAVDLSIRVWLSEHRVRFLLDHPLDVLIVVVPVLRPLRIIRFGALLRPLMATGIVARDLRKRAAHWAFVGAAIVIVVATAIAGIVERETEGGIENWGTVIWWAIATITTVGYGDVVPVSPMGRIVGVLLMLVGIGVFGVLTANIAAWFVEQTQKSEQKQISDELARLREELRLLREEIAGRDRQ